MSNEEKKAIEYLKRHIMPYENEDGNIEFLINDVLLHLIEKQQKEIEEKNVAINKMSKDISRQLKEIERLNFENHMLKKWNKQLDQECISKDKIREKIEHYNNELEYIKNGEEFENEKPMYYWGKVALENLLEEN